MTPTSPAGSLHPEGQSPGALNQQVSDLRDSAVRSRLTGGLPAVLWMLDTLDITRKDQAVLLDLSSRSLQRALQGKLPKLNADQITRMSLITGICKALHILRRGEGEAAAWIHQANGRLTFSGQTPLGYMLTRGIPGMFTVRQLLDADRSGQFGDASAEDRRRAAEVTVHRDFL